MTDKEIEALLARQIARNEINLLSSIAMLENEIIGLIATIDTRKDGRIAGVSRSLPQAQAALKQVRKAFLDIYMREVEGVLDSYTEIDNLALDYFDADTFHGISAVTLKAQISLDRSYHTSLVAQTQDNLSSIFLDHTINGKSKDDLINSVRGALSGSVDTAGRSMASHAKTIAHDGQRAYYATANDSVLPKRANDKFKYFGSLINDSRPWCASHVGKIYTRKQISEFDSSSWAGKKAGSTIIVRGGYNCRHSWLRIIE